MSQGFYIWSTTASSNGGVDSSINFAEGQAPATLNDSARAVMARMREFANDISGGITTGGTSTAYTATSNQVFDTLAHMHNQIVAIVPNVTSGAAPTLAVDGLTAKTIRFAPGVDLPAGTLIQGTPYLLTYNNTDGYFYCHQSFGNNPYCIPIGGILPWTTSTVPNSNFVFPFGQAISRTTYATLFAAYNADSLKYGSGDGSTTFNVPDIRGRSIAGLDNMGGSAASRLTNVATGFNADATIIGATGGNQSKTIAQANLPNVNFTVSFGTITTTIIGGSAVLSGNAAGSYAGGGGLTNSTNMTSGAVTASTSIGASTAASGGSGTALATVQPTIVLPFILRVA